MLWQDTKPGADFGELFSWQIFLYSLASCTFLQSSVLPQSLLSFCSEAGVSGRGIPGQRCRLNSLTRFARDWQSATPLRTNSAIGRLGRWNRAMNELPVKCRLAFDSAEQAREK